MKSTSASFSAAKKAGGTVSMTTSRTSAASPPVTGTVGVSFEGKSVGKNSSIHPTAPICRVQLISSYGDRFSFLRTMIFDFFCPDIPTTAEEREVRDLLMTIPNIGNLYVKKEGDCAKFTWQITWLSRKGDLPEAMVRKVIIQ